MLKVSVIIASSVILMMGCVEPQKIPNETPPVIAPKAQEPKREVPRKDPKELCGGVEDSAMRDCINLRFDHMLDGK